MRYVAMAAVLTAAVAVNSGQANATNAPLGRFGSVVCIEQDTIQLRHLGPSRSSAQLRRGRRVNGRVIQPVGSRGCPAGTDTYVKIEYESPGEDRILSPAPGRRAKVAGSAAD